MSATGGDLVMRVHTDALPLDETLDATAWDALAHRHGASFSQGTAWLTAWWQHYGARRTPYTFVFSIDGVPVAAVPTFVEHVGVRPLRIKVAKLAGCDHSPFPRAALMVTLEHRQRVVDAVVRHLIDDVGCSLVSLGPFRAEEGDGVQAVDGTADLQRTTDAPGVGMWLDMSGGDQHFTRRMSTSTRKSLRRKAKRLRATDGFAMERVGDAELAAAFEDFRAMHQSQWQAMGHQGHFADWPDATGFHAEFTRAMSASGELHLYRATMHGTPVAYEYMVRFGDRAHSLLAARSLDERWTRAGVGSVLLDFAAAAEADGGAVEVDLGRGHYDYKASHGARSADLVRLRFVGRRITTRLAASTWFAVAWTSHVAYYRLWFGTARPALKLPAKALARWFIKIQI